MKKGVPSGNNTQSSLLEKVKDPKDEESWQRFYNLYSNLVYSVALAAGLSPTEADDVRAETFIVTVKKMPTFKYDRRLGSFRAWLLNTTRWRIGDQFRKRQPQLSPLRERPTLSDRTATIDRIPDPDGLELEAIWDEELHKQILETALKKVKGQASAKQYQIFDQFVLKKKSVEEVAQKFQVTTNTIYVAKFRVCQLLKKELKNLKSILP